MLWSVSKQLRVVRQGQLRIIFSTDVKVTFPGLVKLSADAKGGHAVEYSEGDRDEASLGGIRAPQIGARSALCRFCRRLLSWHFWAPVQSCATQNASSPKA